MRPGLSPGLVVSEQKEDFSYYKPAKRLEMAGLNFLGAAPLSGWSFVTVMIVALVLRQLNDFPLQ